MPRKTKVEIAKEHVPHLYFEEFWDAYPRKVNRLEASIAFARLDPDHSLAAKIVVAVRYQKVYGCLRTKPDGDKSFIPHASTWLNQRRWEDELESAPSAPADRLTTYARDTLIDALTGGTHVGSNGATNGSHPDPRRALPDAG